ncbi:MAG TPA: MFS transporter [Acidobacteriaceae bacterium]|jgi:MFS family permease
MTPKPQRRPWTIAILLGIGVVVNYLDRVNLSVAHDALSLRFGISDVTFGYLLSAYSWTYAVMQLPSGSLLDRFGVRRVMVPAVLIWAVASGFASIAPSIGLLFASRFLLGIGEAPTFPANSKSITQWFPPDRRGMPTATFDAASKFSIGLCTAMLGAILLRHGVQTVFAVTAVLSLGYAVLFAWIYRDPAPQASFALKQTTFEGDHELSLGALLKTRKVWGAAIGSGAYNYCFYLLLTWLPYYLQRGLRMSPQQVIVWVAVPWLVASVTGFLLGGRLTDRLIRSGRKSDPVRRLILITGMAFAVLVVAPCFLQSPRLILLCLTLALCGISTASPIAWTLPGLLAPGSSGRLGGVLNFSGQIAAITAPIITGYIHGHTGSFNGAFAVAGSVVFLGLMSYSFLLGPIEPIAPVLSAPGDRAMQE